MTGRNSASSFIAFLSLPSGPFTVCRGKNEHRSSGGEVLGVRLGTLCVVSFDPHSKPEPFLPYGNRETSVSIQISTHTHSLSLSLSLCVQVCVCINMGGTQTHLCVCSCVCMLIHLCLRARASACVDAHRVCVCRPEVRAPCFPLVTFTF